MSHAGWFIDILKLLCQRTSSRFELSDARLNQQSHPTPPSGSQRSWIVETVSTKPGFKPHGTCLKHKTLMLPLFLLKCLFGLLMGFLWVNQKHKAVTVVAMLQTRVGHLFDWSTLQVRVRTITSMGLFSVSSENSNIDTQIKSYAKYR